MSVEEAGKKKQKKQFLYINSTVRIILNMFTYMHVQNILN
jgi:hypothetical protein